LKDTKSTFFVSDAHLGFDNEDVEARRISLFLRFLETVEQRGSMLVIVGDLFDFWFEYPSVVPRKYFNVLCALKRICDQRIAVHYVTGNHDFWMDGFLESQMGITVHKNPFEFELNSKKFYIAHGDGLAKKDVGYRILKRILRHPMNIRLFRLVHPDIGFALARFFSRLSRNHRVFQDEDAEYFAFAKERFEEGFDCVLLGHTHRPCICQEKDRTYINTGDWIENFSYAEFDGHRLMLKYWAQGE
jgi:UDP-2,3-diacylglucosamine hydrolase